MLDLSDEHVEKLFAELRGDQRQRVRAPGVTAARTTVRRRRAAVALAAGVTLAVSGATAAGTAGLGPARELSQHLGGKSPSRDGLTRQLSLAGAALPRKDSPPGGRVLRKVVTLDGASLDRNVVVAGTYVVELACAGAGSTRIVAKVGRDPATGGAAEPAMRMIGQRAIPCTERAAATSTTVLVPENGVLAIEAYPDAQAEGRSALAYQLMLSPTDRERLDVDAVAAVDAGTARPVAPRVSYFVTADHTSEAVSLPAGSYRLEVACAGLGALQATVTTTGAVDADPVPPDGVVCRGRPQVRALAFTAAGGTTMTLRLTPDPAAAGQAAVAYRIVRG